MARDGGLRPLFADRIKVAHWQSVETWSTGQGVPDTNVCVRGIETWIEFKGTATNAVRISTEQIGWIERRIRAGGRVMVIVRYQCTAGPRRVARDELFIFRGADVRALAIGGISAAIELDWWEGGPRAWDWDAVAKILGA
jgi:hypothetical protein